MMDETEAPALDIPACPPQTLVMLDPDARDGWGHFLPYDQQLMRTARAMGLNCVLLCSPALDQALHPAEADAVIPCAPIFSWTIGNRTHARPQDVEKFARELKAGLDAVETAFPEGDLCLFHYMSSLQVAEVLAALLADRPRFRAVLNLFYATDRIETDAEYEPRWRPVMQRLAAHPRIRLTHVSPQAAASHAARWQMPGPVLEHPSTTFADDQVAGMMTRPRGAPDGLSGRARVLFPGGVRLDKGFDLTMAAAERLRGRDDLAVRLRVRLDKSDNSALAQAFFALGKDGLGIVDQPLDNGAFVALLAEADIVVLPYRPDGFRRRPSGILVDAMLLGKPVVVLENTWLADFVRQREIGVAVPETAEAIEQGLATVMADHARFAGKAAEARRHYLENNSWAAMVRHIGRLAGFALPALSAVRTRRDLLASLALSDRPEDLTALLGLGAAGLILDQPETRSLLADCALFRLALERAATRSSALSAPGGGHSALGRVIGDSFLQEMIVTGDP